tara:strand:- start:1619 stop:1891 length:273 start_codon:yes stop_codon:yes gene_type:complete
MKIYEGVSESEEFITENPTITIDEAQEILVHHNYHNSRSVLLDDCNLVGAFSVRRVLIYESTKDNIEIICQECRISKRVSTKAVFDWMGY